MLRAIVTQALCLSALLMSPITGIAGDVASLDFIGFSKDGNAYYIEYGRQDGSGFPYATLFRSSPGGGEELEHVLIREESAKADTARLRLFPSIPDTSFDEGSMIFARTHTDVDSMDQDFAFYLRNSYANTDIPVRVKLELTDTPAGDDCYGFFETEKVLSLSLIKNDITTVPVARDVKPAGCIRNFRPGRIYAADIADKQHLALLLMVDRLGFEGADVRWMAFSINIDDEP